MRVIFSLVMVMQFALTQVATAQADSTKSIVNGIFVGVSPLAALNEWTGYQLSSGVGFADRYEVHLDAGYLVGRRDAGTFKGMRLRPSFRFYFAKSKPNDSFRIFAALSYQYRNLSEDIFAAYSEFDGKFTKNRDIIRDRVMHAGYISFGAKHAMSGNFWLDFSVGIGPATERVMVPQFPNSTYIDTGSGLFKDTKNESGSYSLGAAFLNLGLGVRL